MHQGYIKLWRKFMETSFFKNSECVHLALYLLLQANHKPTKFIFNKKEEILETGQIMTGREKIRLDTGITAQSIRTCLNILKNVKFLSRRVSNRFSIISINNYCDYQKTNQLNNQHITDNEIIKTNQLTNQQLTSNQPATNQQLTTYKNDKNDKNDKNCTVSNKSNDIDIKSNDINKKKFIIPTILEIKSYCSERKNNIDAEKFFYSYESKGWLIGRSPMKSWQAAIRTWEKNNFDNDKKGDTPDGTKPIPGKYAHLSEKI